MASEIRVDKINSLSGVGTVTLSPTGVDIAGITTAATLRATTGIVTSLTAGSLTSLGAVSGTTGTFSAAVSGTTGTFSGAVSGTTGTFTGDVDIADKIIHTGDTNTAIRFPEADTITFEANGFEQVRIDNDVQMFVEANSKQAKLQLHREDVSINADDVVGQITFTGRDAGGAGIQRVGAAISAVASNNWDTVQSTGYSATHLDFYTQAQQSAYSTLTPRVRIASDGKVGINSTSPSNLFTIESTDNNQFAIKSNDTNSDIVLADTGGSTRVRHTNTTFEIWTGGVAGSSYAQSSARRMQIDSSGNTTLNTGNLVIGTSGKGIDFSATGGGSNTSGESELFNDYEQGSCTILIHDAAGSNISVTNHGTKYTKIGNRVFIEGKFVFAESGSKNGGLMSLYQLPFTPAQSIQAQGVYWYDGTSDGADVTGVVYITSSGNGYLKQATTIGQPSNNKYLTFNEIQKNSSRPLHFSFSYTIS